MNKDEKAKDKLAEVIELIIKEAIKELDLTASVHHFICFDELKLIWKKTHE